MGLKIDDRVRWPLMRHVFGKVVWQRGKLMVEVDFESPYLGGLIVPSRGWRSTPKTKTPEVLG